MSSVESARSDSIPRLPSAPNIHNAHGLAPGSSLMRPISWSALSEFFGRLLTASSRSRPSARMSRSSELSARFSKPVRCGVLVKSPRHSSVCAESCSSAPSECESDFSRSCSACRCGPLAAMLSCGRGEEFAAEAETRPPRGSIKCVSRDNVAWAPAGFIRIQPMNVSGRTSSDEKSASCTPGITALGCSSNG